MNCGVEGMRLGSGRRNRWRRRSSSPHWEINLAWVTSGGSRALTGGVRTDHLVFLEHRDVSQPSTFPAFSEYLRASTALTHNTHTQYTLFSRTPLWIMQRWQTSGLCLRTSAHRAEFNTNTHPIPRLEPSFA